MTRLRALAPGALTLIAALTLSACVTTPEPTATPRVAAPAAEPETGAMVAARGPAPRPVALRDAMAMRALDPAGVKQLIGPPSFVRQDGGATIWQYSVHGCVMDLFWYRSEAGLALLHVEARDVHTPRSAEMQVCLDDLWKARSEHAES